VGCLAMIEPAGELSLLDRVEDYLQRHRMPATRFGKIVVCSPSLVGRMRVGKSLRRTTIERIEAQLLSPPRPMTLGQFKAKRYRVAMQEQVRAEIAERDRRLTDPNERGRDAAAIARVAGLPNRVGRRSG
jgi:hypothetical protein